MKYNFLIVTSSYPAISGDSFEGACVEVFAQALVHLGNDVTILTQCVKRNYYKDSPSLKVRRFKWSNHVKPLSTLKAGRDIGKIYLYFFKGLREAEKIIRENKIDIIICAWALPSGLFGLYLKKRYAIPYVVWALGSDIWSYSNSYIARYILRSILNHALHIYADGQSLIDEINNITRRKAHFHPTSRKLPEVETSYLNLDSSKVNFLFVGRYHINKGPDILVESILRLSPALQEKSYFHFFGIGDMRGSLESIIEKIICPIV